MIDFEMTEEQAMARDAMREFAASELRPAARASDDGAAIAPELKNKLWSTGLVQSMLDEADTDQPRSRILNAIVLEELAAADASLALALAAPMSFVQAILDHGNASQRASLLPAFQGGEFKAAAVAVMEPTFGFDVSATSTVATRAGDNWKLDGRKCMVPLAGACSHFIVTARDGLLLRAFVVAANQPGVKVVPPKGTLALRALEMSEVVLDAVTLSADQQLGGEHGCDVQCLVDSGRAALAAVMTGMSRGVLEYAIPYLKDRVAHGSPLARKQVIAFRLVDAHMAIQAMRWMAWRAAWSIESNEEPTRHAQLAFTYASEQTMTIADEALQAFGGHGFVRAHPIEMWYRNARALGLLEGVAGV
ncbi:alkylation response protein AidB-like acyl-CoA dehydrogenase [Variovorax boronicumulans]|uniref:acyl-CoA dehydrogenase family protein n=1 Tax=Variovorax boronicumulans TaxID=436515 RepID=UPI0027871EA4|nr:acyl-CoA dehydrogenase [Variovorax boronicumulans]MDP9994536.1 alkylation response protein AidB-like acyl-CoA dehydrogenase [Variovorax boronicumulans]MDQ0005765.1 alkylation response protein AidB-like acyl-CoA dehydrogenase [Variovorax boronicumulans]MDQ0044399.1 alkylation response protein AidB-like acyl-CoA dehydrogenase [Variovorax boronicumulans]